MTVLEANVRAAPECAPGAGTLPRQVAATGVQSTTLLSSSQQATIATLGSGAVSGAANDTAASLELTGAATSASADGTGGAQPPPAQAIGVDATNVVATAASAIVRTGPGSDAVITVANRTATTIVNDGTGGAFGGAGASHLLGHGTCAAGLSTRSAVSVDQASVATPMVNTQSAAVHIAAAGTAPRPIATAAPSPFGAAQALGLFARNEVITGGAVSIAIDGPNRGPIEVLIEMITRIVNRGAAEARSAPSAATPGPAPSPRPDTAIGAVIRNDIAMASTMSRRVEGDNVTPIDLFIELVSRIFNFGRAEASRDAIGLAAENNVRLNGAIDLHITGSNDAPISARIRFVTEIENAGEADARRVGQIPEVPRQLADVAMTAPVSCVGTALMLGIANAQVANAPAGTGSAENRASYRTTQKGEAACASGEALALQTASSGDAIGIGNAAAVVLVSAQKASAAAVATTPTPSPTTIPSPVVAATTPTPVVAPPTTPSPAVAAVTTSRTPASATPRPTGRATARPAPTATQHTAVAGHAQSARTPALVTSATSTLSTLRQLPSTSTEAEDQSHVLLLFGLGLGALLRASRLRKGVQK